MANAPEKIISSTYILSEEKDDSATRMKRFKLQEMTSMKEVECRVDFAKLYTYSMVICRGKLFAINKEGSAIVVCEVSSGKIIQQLSLDVSGVTLFNDEVFAWNYNDMFLVEGVEGEMTLKKVASSPQRFYNMSVVRKTNEEFAFAVDTMDDEVILVSCKQGEMKTLKIPERKKKFNSLIGVHNELMYVVRGREEEAEEIVEFHEGQEKRRFPLDGVKMYSWWGCVWGGMIYLEYEEDGTWKEEVIDPTNGNRQNSLLEGLVKDVIFVCALE